MSFADFMLPEVSPESVRLEELASMVPPSRLFAGYDPQHKELLIDGNLNTGVEELNSEILATSYKPTRVPQFIDSLPATPTRSILWDMEDARAFDSRVYTGKDLNIFQYNRRIGSRHAVLWRLNTYIEPSRAIGHAGRVEDGLQFEDKKPVVYWRGGMTGSRWLDPFQRTGVLSINTAADFVDNAEHYSRFKAALISKNSHAFDLKLAVPGAEMETKPWLGELDVLGDIVPPAQQLEHKYMLCLNGNDLASNLYWVLSTQSVAFKEDTAYECLPDYFLKPWVHYVPIARGLADLQEKFDFCQANPGICKTIIENANHAYNQIIDAAMWKSAELEVLERLDLL